VLSLAHPYRKTRRNLDRTARRQGFVWRDPSVGEKRELLAGLARIAAEHGLSATLCSQPELLAAGLGDARCIDAARLSDIAQRPLAIREKGNRPGCRCALSRDIGSYDTCPHGCVYCYAVSDRERAVARTEGEPKCGILKTSPPSCSPGKWGRTRRARSSRPI